MNALNGRVQGTSVKRMTVDALVRSLAVSRDRPLMLFLGAGASMSSGMPSAGQCIWEWKREIFLSNNPGLEEQFSELSLPSVRARIQSWLDQQRRFPPLGHADEYGAYIEACFARSEDRRLYFERWVKQCKPHLGYQLMALLAADGLVKSVWTPNFDGLASRSAAAANVTPIEIGIDCQQRLYRAPGERELACISMHGDYRYDSLKNTPGELVEQEATLRASFVQSLTSHTVVVCGYSGRDDSVMRAFAEYAANTPTGSSRPLFWTQYGDDEPLDAVSSLLSTPENEEANRFLVQGVSFDDLMRRLALYLSKGDARLRVTEILDRYQAAPVDQRSPFALPRLPVTGLIKSNAIPMTPPRELLEFDLHQWPAVGTVWSRLRDTGDEYGFVAAPFRGKVYAVASPAQIQTAFGKNLNGEVKRVPLNDEDLRYEGGVINHLVRRATVRTLSRLAKCSTDGDSLVWDNDSGKSHRVNGLSWRVCDAALLQVRSLGDKLALVIKPTLHVTDDGGALAPKEIERLVKQKVLGYQHNKEFNEATEFWRKRLLPKRDLALRFPDSEDGISFVISGRPVFARITDERERTVSLTESQEVAASQSGLQLSEPRLHFAQKSANGVALDTHPVRGLVQNRPFDAALTASGIASRIRVAVITPSRDAKRIREFLGRLHDTAQPGKDSDYLPPFPGFGSAFHCPLELPDPAVPMFVTLGEPDDTTPEAARLLAGRITSALSSLAASARPDVTLIYIPSRWQPYRGYQSDDEDFDLHDFVKAAAIPNGCATQFIEEDTLQNPQQCRVRWWLSLALYVKSMRTPWTLPGLDKDSAYVGLGFSVKRKTSADAQGHVVLGCSHLYSPTGQGLQFRLSKIENPIMRSKNPFMSFDDARRLGEGIRELFFNAHLRLPNRVVVHKQTPFLEDERKGLQVGLDGVACVELLQIFIDDTLRYVASHPTADGKFDIDGYPIRRGTTVVIDDMTALLWVHGVSTALNPRLRYFQGKRRIPAPLVIRRHAGTTDLMTLAEEVLGFSKMNFNSFDLYGQLPATIETSRRVAGIGALLDRFTDRSYDYRLFM
ncbi:MULTISPECIES: SIR2 family protein [Burkholderia]|uniref:SIR2 family protein n=5 Tax=Pseudomonadota TaxID=1224 RepID=UPI001FC7D9A5|nr:SIR2 family protein [Burkholderia ambifaria]